MASASTQSWSLDDEWPGHAAPVRLIEFGADGRMFTADTELQATIRMPNGSECKADLRSDEEKVRSSEIVRAAAFDAAGVYVACGDRILAADSTFTQRWSYVPPRILLFLIASPTALVFDGDALVVSFNSGWVGRFDRTGRRLERWRDHGAPRTMSTLADGRIAATDGFRVVVRDAKTWMRLLDHRPDARVYGLAVPKVGNLLAVRTLEDVRIVRADTGQEHARWPVPEGLPLVRWSPGGEVLAIGGVDEVRLYSPTGVDLGGIRESQHLTSIAFHPDGRLASGWGDGTVRFYAP